MTVNCNISNQTGSVKLLQDRSERLKVKLKQLLYCYKSLNAYVHAIQYATLSV